MKEDKKPITIKFFIVKKFVFYFIIAAMAVFLFKYLVNSVQFSGYERNPFEKLRVDLSNYKTIDVEKLKDHRATIEVIDRNLMVIDSVGDEDNTGYVYSEQEFSRLMINHLRDYDVRYQKIIDEKGNKLFIVLKQNFSRESFEQLKTSSLFYTGIFIAGAALIFVVFTFLFARSIYKPIKTSFLVIQSNISKIPVDQSHVDANSVDLLEAQEVLISYNIMVDEMNKIKQEKQETLEQSNRLISNLSHDLKSPVTILKGYSDILMHEELSRAEELKYFASIYESTEHLGEMVNLLFEQVKFQYSDYELNLTKVDMNEFLRSVCANYYDIFEKNGFEMIIDIPEDAFDMDIDPIHMKRTFGNILGNCLSHNPSPVPVCVSAAVENGKYMIRIKDNGIGISKENRERVFEPFFQQDSFRSTRHSGLGLSIAKQVIERHGGTIRLVSEEGYKTVFEISFKVNK